MLCFPKYLEHRHEFKEGDVLLTKADKFTSNAIQVVDKVDGKKAYYTHSGVIFLVHGRVLILDAHPDKGTNPAYVSHRIRTQSWDDFCVIRTKCTKSEISRGMLSLFERNEKYRAYELKLLYKVIRYQLTGKWSGQNGLDKDICSEVTQYLFIALGIESHFPKNLSRPFLTPHDHYRIAKVDTSNFKILFNDYVH